jgi:putative NADH-flavin reductase
VVVADVLVPAEIGPAVAGADAVVSALGPRSYGTASSTISAGTASIISAMRATGSSRLVVVSAAPMASDDQGTLPYRLLVGPLLRRGYADMALMAEATRRSGVDWTILRPPRLTDGPRTGTWRQATNANLRRGNRISRADLAEAMLASLDDPDAVKATSPSATDLMAVAGRDTVCALRRPPRQPRLGRRWPGEVWVDWRVV